MYKSLNCALITFLFNFPTLVLGIESKNKISSGNCHFGNDLRRWLWISSFFTDLNSSRNTIRANGLSSHLGCGIPTTPFIPWSVDLTETEAQQYLTAPSRDFIFITHSPPLGCLDEMYNRQHVGSTSIRTFIETTRPSFVVCGHIHENWNGHDRINGISVINAGPFGYDFMFPSSRPALRQNQVI